MTESASFAARTSTRLVLVRHGQTAHNAGRRLQGHLDAPLDAVGQEQAHRLARHLKAQGLARPIIYSSDLGRAHATAEALHAELGGTLSLSPDLREIGLGTWEGRTHDEIAAGHPEHYGRFWGGDPACRAPGGETPAEVAARVHAFTLRHWPREGETVVLVSHGVAITSLLSRLLELDYQATWASGRVMHGNTAYTVLEVHPHSRAVLRSDIARADHLD